MLIVANHTSWLDIIVFSAAGRVSFVAKSEVATLAVLRHAGAGCSETVFVERARRSARPARRATRSASGCSHGDALVLFPEGTSNDGNRVLPFKSALMGAVEAERRRRTQGGKRAVPVQPVSIAYVGLHGMPMGRENRPLFAWYGDMELVPHLWEALTDRPDRRGGRIPPADDGRRGRRPQGAGGRGGSRSSGAARRGRWPGWHRPDGPRPRRRRSRPGGDCAERRRRA